MDQRQFFVTQVFEKGLTPYAPHRPQAAVSVAANRVLITDIDESTRHRERKSNAPKRPVERMPYERSKTTCAIQLRREENTNGQTSGKIPTGTAFHADRATTGYTIGGSGRCVGETESPMVQKAPRRLKPVRHDLRALKKDPSLLFPHMNTLILDGCESKHIKTEQRDHRERKKSNKHSVPRNKTSKRMSVRMSISKQIKLVQKLTSSLPDHLMASASKQIRQMSNSDAIYENKDKLLKDNKELLLRQVVLDPRWRHLIGSLSMTRGLGLNWEKTSNEKWVVSKNDADKSQPNG